MMAIELRSPYLVFIADVDDETRCKSAAGICDWQPEKVAGQLRFGGNKMDLGVPDLGLEQAVAMGVRSLIIGVASVGGALQDDWVPVINAAAKAGLDIVSGLHTPLQSNQSIVAAAQVGGGRLINVRVAPDDLPVGSALKRSGKRLLTVGTDCAVGKKYTALSITHAMRQQGMAVDFRATGQTGIMIAGGGIAIDSVVADFISGAAELVSPANTVNHWDVIEGQGSLSNPSYAGVSLGLLHGSQPDAIIVCHHATRTTISSCPQLNLPSIGDTIELNLMHAGITNPAVICLGVSVNTSGLESNEVQSYLSGMSKEIGLPCVDPVRQGCDDFVQRLCSLFPQ